MRTLQRATIIIPTYNERENIQKVIPILLSLFERIKTWDMQILVVDDSSPDKTGEVVKSFAAQSPRVHLFTNKQKAGLGGAYLKGMAHAFDEMNSDVAFEFDADLSHDPEKIPLFLEKIEEGYDLVLGSRYIAGGGIPDDWGLHRKFMSIVGNKIIQVVLIDFRIHDWTGGYRALTKKVFQAVQDELQSERFSGYTFQIGFLTKAVKKGFAVTEIPFQFVDRTIGESKLGMEYIKNTLQYILKLRGKEVVQSRLFKFLITGGIGTIVQLISLSAWRRVTLYELAVFLAIETAIASNFLFSNFWTFSDRKVSLNSYPEKFLQFNLASGGSILVQMFIALLGKNLIGLYDLFPVPLIGRNVDTGLVFAIVGILIGMSWNFFAYNTFIWKKKKHEA